MYAVLLTMPVHVCIYVRISILTHDAHRRFAILRLAVLLTMYVYVYIHAHICIHMHITYSPCLYMYVNMHITMYLHMMNIAGLQSFDSLSYSYVYIYTYICT